MVAEIDGHGARARADDLDQQVAAGAGVEKSRQKPIADIAEIALQSCHPELRPASRRLCFVAPNSPSQVQPLQSTLPPLLCKWGSPKAEKQKNFPSMSRLDSFIRRLSAQRDILNDIRDQLSGIEGPILELGLGNGRTYDHLRELFPDRRIIAFDREAHAYSASTPDPDNLVLGEIKETAQDFLGIGAALAHADIGTGHDDIDAVTLTWLPQLMAGVLKPGGIAVSGLPLAHPGLMAMPQPATVPQGRYFLYHRA